MASPNILGIGEDDREPLGGGGILEIRQPDPAVTTPAQALGQLYTNVTDEIRRQRQISAERGLWDEETGLPTGKGLLDVARQYGDTMLLGTSAPGRTPKSINVGGVDLPLNPDGTVTLFHATKTPDAAQRILNEKTLRSAAEPSVYLSTHSSGTGYGDHVLAVDVNPAHLRLDDEFPGGRADFRIDRKAYQVTDARQQIGTTSPDAATPTIGENGAISLGGKTVGRVKYDHGDGQTRIADIQLDPSAQGQGTGSAVIKQIQDEAAARGNPVVLTTDAMRGKAAQADQRRLYERLGFVPNKGTDAVTEKVGGRTIREEYVWRPPRGQENQ